MPKKSHPPTTTTATLEKLLRVKDVSALTTLSKVTLWHYVKRGQFPQPYDIGPGRIAWKESDVVAWLETRRRPAAAR